MSRYTGLFIGPVTRDPIRCGIFLLRVPLQHVFSSFSAAPERAMCDLCPAGKFTSTPGNTACDDCTPGYLCLEGASAPQPCRGRAAAAAAAATAVAAAAAGIYVNRAAVNRLL